MKKNLLIMCMLAFSSLAFSQGVTTSAMSGKITDKDGAPLPGATVLAVHTPTGSEFGQVTDADGLFRIANMNVGGPYTVTVSFVGYDPIIKQGIYLELGRTYKLNTSMSETITQLEGVVVTASAVFDGNRTGSSTIISKDDLQNTPTVTRSLQDFTRLTPQASNATGGISIAGINNRFNAIYIDGAVNNDVFGLAPSGTNGGQIGISPISVDAIEQIQVVVAPYDITKGGFAGGGINAVTRSGSNKFEGSAYYFFRNESLAGLTPVDDETLEREKLDQFTAKTYGFRLGGPIIKNKVFFFVNAEIQDDQTPRPYDVGTYNGDATAAELDGLASFLQNEYGYDAGGYGNQTRTLRGTKILGRFDFNISRNHKLTVRHSYTKGESTSPGGSSANTIQFGGGGIYFPSVTNSSALELKSAFGSKFSNNLIVGYTNVTDDRDPIGDPFPYVRINDGSGSIRLGSERFSTANFLEQKIFTITNNFNIYKGKHTFTVGTHLEFFNINNVFIRENFGSYRYNSLADFMDNANTGYIDFDRSYSLVDNVTGNETAAAAKFKAMQLAFYGQDEWQVTDNFKLNIGLRLDIPVFTDDPLENQYFNTATVDSIARYAPDYDLKGARVGSAPKASLMFSPRVGFNWNVNGEDDIQIRGGIGVFTSRIPFVWPGGMYNNNGRTVGGFGNRSGGTFNPNWDQQPTNGETIPLPAGDSGSGQIDIFAENFKFPQLLRSSIAVDKKLPWGLVGTAEVIWSKTLNNVFYENLNLKPSTTRLTGTGDDRLLFDRRDEVDDTFSRILLGSNTSEGYAINATFQLTKSFTNGFAGSVSYTYGDSYAVFEGTSSQNSSQWRGTYAINGRNNAPLGRSDFSMGSRFVAYGSYTFDYFNHMATTISLFYNGQSGRAFSYTYNDFGDLNNEDSRGRSLIYVPTDASDINLVDYDDNGTTITTAQQWSALDSYISNDKYLSSRRGQYAEKNSSRVPFTSIIDLKIAQDFYITAGDQKHTLQITMDIFNFGNFLNKNWGRRYFSNFGQVQLLDFEGFQADNTTPEFTYNVDRTELQDYLTINDAGVNSSRWYMQIGVRYSF